MTEYISRESAAKALMTHRGLTPIARLEAATAVCHVPAADVVEVVRCKDCSACMEFAPEYKNDGYYGTCRRLLFIVLDNDDAKVKADGYCNYGRRKEG